MVGFIKTCDLFYSKLETGFIKMYIVKIVSTLKKTDECVFLLTLT